MHKVLYSRNSYTVEKTLVFKTFHVGKIVQTWSENLKVAEIKLSKLVKQTFNRSLLTLNLVAR